MSQSSTAMVAAACVAPQLRRIISKLSLEFGFSGNFTTFLLILFVFLIWKFGGVSRNTRLLNEYLIAARVLQVMTTGWCL